MDGQSSLDLTVGKRRHETARERARRTSNCRDSNTLQCYKIFENRWDFHIDYGLVFFAMDFCGEHLIIRPSAGR